MCNKIYGYTRVSTQDQNDDRQMVAMKQAGVEPENIFADKQSGKDFNRPAYQKLLNVLHEGDTLIIKSIDRLGRNYDEIIEQWRLLTRKKGVKIIILDMPFLHNWQTCDLLGRLIADIMLYILSYFAQFEREEILGRQKEGIAAAKKRGVQFGRKPMDKPEKFEHYRIMWKRGEISANSAAKQLGVGRNTFLRWVRKKQVS